MAGADLYGQAHNALRANGLNPNPWRIGKYLGEAGIDAPSPYASPASRGRFLNGVTYGLGIYQTLNSALSSELRSGAWYGAAIPGESE
jgi:hypothetical protein